MSLLVGDRGDLLVVELRADGGGEPPAGLADRVAAIGGRLLTGTAPEGGSFVRAELPS
jgi:hypothetical protein